MNIKTSSNLDISSSPVSISQQQAVNIHSPTEDDTSHEAADEVDDAGGGTLPDQSCESVLVNGISVLLAILETRKAVSNSFAVNDYLDACSAGKKQMYDTNATTNSCWFVNNNREDPKTRLATLFYYNMIYNFSGIGGSNMGSGEGMGGILTAEEMSRQQVCEAFIV